MVVKDICLELAGFRFTIFICEYAGSSLEVLAKVKGVGCIGYKAGLAFHCFDSVYTAISTCLTLDIGIKKDSRCLCRNCLGWCRLLSAFIYACKSCECLGFSLNKLHSFCSKLASHISSFLVKPSPLTCDVLF